MKKTNTKKKTKTKQFFTADGKLIEIGMTIWVPGPWYAHCEKVVKIDSRGPLSGYAGTVFQNGRIPPDLVFSTSKLASEYWEKNKSENSK